MLLLLLQKVYLDGTGVLSRTRSNVRQGREGGHGHTTEAEGLEADPGAGQLWDPSERLCGEGVRGQAIRKQAEAEVAESQGSGRVGAPRVRVDQLS